MKSEAPREKYIKQLLWNVKLLWFISRISSCKWVIWSYISTQDYLKPAGITVIINDKSDTEYEWCLKYYSTGIKDTEVLTCLNIFEFVKGSIESLYVCLNVIVSVIEKQMFLICILIFRSYFRRKWVVLVPDKISGINVIDS